MLSGRIRAGEPSMALITRRGVKELNRRRSSFIIRNEKLRSEYGARVDRFVWYGEAARTLSQPWTHISALGTDSTRQRPLPSVALVQVVAKRDFRTNIAESGDPPRRRDVEIA